MPELSIAVDDLRGPEIAALLQRHLDLMYEITPAGSVYALDLNKLRLPEITFWTIWDDTLLVGCGALRELSSTHGEIKSMRTPSAARRRGAGRALLQHIIFASRSRGYKMLSLETGSHSAFGAAQSLYRSHGFSLSGPFGDYLPNEHSVFMQLQLSSSAA